MSGYDGYSAAYGRVYSMPPYRPGGPASQSVTPPNYRGVGGFQQQLAAVGGAVVAAATAGGGGNLTASSMSKASYHGLCLSGHGGVDLLHPSMVYPGKTLLYLADVLCYLHRIFEVVKVRLRNNSLSISCIPLNT